MLTKLFSPAIGLMNGLKYPQKFGLISLLFILPLALVMVLLVSEIDSRVEFAQKELYGDQYLRSLRPLIEHVPQSQLVAYRYLSGNSQAKAELLDRQAQIDRDFTALSGVEQSLGAALNTGDQFKILQGHWQDLKTRVLSLDAATSNQQHAELVASVRDLISYVGDSSNLILDPDLDSYYMMDAVLLKLPEGQDLIGQLGLLEANLLTHPTLTVGEKDSLVTLAGLVKANLNALQKGQQTAFRNNPAQNLKPALAVPLQDLTSTTEIMLDELDKNVINSPAIGLTPAQAGASVAKALGASFNFWDKSVVELDRLLQNRIDGFNQKKITVEIFSVVILVLVAYLLIGFYLSVMRTVLQLGKAAQRMVSGRHGEIVRLDNRDELGQVVAAFNQVASALLSASAELQLRQKTGEKISGQVLGLAAELKTTATQQASSTQVQMATITQLGMSASELSVTAGNIADLTRQVSEAANQAAQGSQQIEDTTALSTRQSEKGMVAVDCTVLVSQEVAAIYQNLLQAMRELNARSEKMRRILRLLSEIAGETHLLAINAALEAAGAGTYGARFGAVAHEVKALADRSAAASKEVVEIVREVDGVIDDTLHSAENGYQKAQQMEEVAGQAGLVIQEMLRISGQSQTQAVSISQLAQEVKQLTSIIEHATTQQQLASREMAEALNGLTVVAQQNAEGSELVSDRAINLEEYSQELNLALVA